MKLPGAPAAPTPSAPAPDSGFGGDAPATPDAQPSSDDKPFDDEPFNAGVEADEQSDPKKYIEQLTGKLGQSLRKYNEDQGQPDLELEKFAINSLLSATHTSDMDSSDQDDIIKKVKEAGNGDDSEDNNNDDSADDNAGEADGDSVSSDFGGDMGGSEPNGSEGSEVNEEESIFLDKPKKNNMFQAGSNDILKGNLKESEKNRIFDKNKIKAKLQETFNQEDMSEPMTEPIVKPVTKPAPDKTQPNIAPSRKNKPFLPMPHPSIQPDPKAKNMGENLGFVGVEEHYFPITEVEAHKVMEAQRGGTFLAKTRQIDFTRTSNGNYNLVIKGTDNQVAEYKTMCEQFFGRKLEEGFVA